MTDDLKNLLQKKSVTDLEAMIVEQKRKIGAEKTLTTLHRLTTELGIMQEVHDHKLMESGRMIHKPVKAAEKPALKSYDDYLKSKK